MKWQQGWIWAYAFCALIRLDLGCCSLYLDLAFNVLSFQQMGRPNQLNEDIHMLKTKAMICWIKARMSSILEDWTLDAMPGEDWSGFGMVISNSDPRELTPPVSC